MLWVSSRVRAQARRGKGGLGAGVPASHHDHIEIVRKNHPLIGLAAPTTGGGFYAMRPVVSRETTWRDQPVLRMPAAMALMERSNGSSQGLSACSWKGVARIRRSRATWMELSGSR
jgi:hypothetical protein